MAVIRLPGHETLLVKSLGRRLHGPYQRWYSPWVAVKPGGIIELLLYRGGMKRISVRKVVVPSRTELQYDKANEVVCDFRESGGNIVWAHLAVLE
jgi:hypothetical protein